MCTGITFALRDGNPTHPYPRVTLRIDFRGRDIGDFVFHCHILNHEDLGMMNIIRVQRKSTASHSSDLVERPPALTRF
ncbi:MAG: multicopper oxidase domain-containing protein [Nitrospira sp.]|nr:multicopper oxidase domain-containing protein [Nitrospira sp.]